MTLWFTHHKLMAIIIVMMILSLLVVWSGSRALNGFRQAKLASDAILSLDLRLDGLNSYSLPDVSSLNGRVSFLNSQIGKAKSQLTPFLQTAHMMGWVPRYGSELRSAQDMLELGSNLTEASQSLLVALEIIMSQASQSNAQLLKGNRINESVLFSLNKAEPYFRDALAILHEASTNIEALQNRDLSSNFATMVTSAKRLTPRMESLANSGLASTELWESLLGYDTPRSYLLVAQNSDELRATGGFIPGAWILSLDQGTITQLEFWDTVDVDNLSAGAPLPPEGLLQSLWAGVWLFRDAGWDPDFPTSAAVMEQIFTLNQDITVDGVIAIDQSAFAEILRAVGPINLPTGEVLDSSSYIRILEHNSDVLGREFMDIALSALLDRLREQGTTHMLLSLMLALDKSLHEKHMLMFFHEEALQETADANGWTGALSRNTGDYLMVVDSNVGFSKVNSNISQHISYSVDLRHDADSSARLEIQYTNRSSKSEDDSCAAQSAGQTGVPYETLKNSCYWDYLRVYTPKGAALVSSSPFPMPDGALYQRIGYNDIENTLRAYNEHEKSVFAGFFNVATGATKIVAFEYNLPSTVLRSQNERLIYNLILQKQPGISAADVEVNVHIPEGYCVRRSTLTTNHVGPNEFQFRINLMSDAVVEIDLERKADCEQPQDSYPDQNVDLPEGITRTAFGSLTIAPATEGSAPNHIQITPMNPIVILGQRFLLTAVVFDVDGRPVLDAKLVWHVDNPLAGTISTSGLLVTGLVTGKYLDAIEVTAISPRGTAFASTNLEILAADDVQNRQLDTVLLYPSEITVRPYQTAGIGALGWDSRGRRVQDLEFEWRMAAVAAGTVNQYGFFKASSTPGRFPNAIEIITRQHTPDGVIENRSFASVTVSNKIQDEALAQVITFPHRVVLEPGQQVNFIARGFDLSGRPIRNLDLSWNIAQASAGTIVQSGSFVAGSEIGQFQDAIQVVATQQTTNESVQATTNITVTVVRPTVPSELELVYLIPAEVTLRPGQQFIFASIGIDAQGNSPPSSVEWKMEVAKAGSIKPSGLFRAGTTPGKYQDAIQVRVTQVLDGKESVVEAYASVNVLGTLSSLEIIGSATLEPGRSMQLSAVGYDANGLEIPFLHFRWSLENSELGSISSSGFLTTRDKPGTYENAIKVVAVDTS